MGGGPAISSALLGVLGVLGGFQSSRVRQELDGQILERGNHLAKEEAMASQ